MTIYKLAAQKETPSPEPAPLVAPWPAILGIGVGVPAATGALLGSIVGKTPEDRVSSALVFGSGAAISALPATLLGMLHDYIITKASKKRTALQTALAYGLPYLAFGTPFIATAPLFLKQSSANPPEEPAPLATEWYKPILTGVGIMAPVGALAGYALHPKVSGPVVGSLAGALVGTTLGMQGMVLDYLVTKIRGKRGPIQNALVYSLPYVPVILGTGTAALLSPWLRQILWPDPQARLNSGLPFLFS
jgi:hypothetical protein